MDEFAMTDFFTFHLLLTVAISLSCGSLMGLAYFGALRMMAGLIVSGSRPMLAIGLMLSRFTLMIAGLAVAFQFGVAAILAMLVGILIGRTIAIRGQRRATP